MPDPTDTPPTNPPATPADKPADPPERDFVAEYRKRERDQREQGQWQQLSGAGVEFALAIGLFALAGYGIDRWLDTSPWGLIGGVGIGFAVGLFLLIRVAKDAFK